MILLDWALNHLMGASPGAQAPQESEGPSSESSAPSWRAAHGQPSGLAQSHDDLRQRMLALAAQDHVERVALLRANGSLFCGRNDAGREQFAATVQQIAVAGRRAARRMGLGAIESIVIESSTESIVVAAGHSICGVQMESPVASQAAREGARELAGGAQEGT